MASRGAIVNISVTPLSARNLGFTSLLVFLFLPLSPFLPPSLSFLRLPVAQLCRTCEGVGGKAGAEKACDKCSGRGVQAREQTASASETELCAFFFLLFLVFLVEGFFDLFFGGGLKWYIYTRVIDCVIDRLVASLALIAHCRDRWGENFPILLR